MQTPESISPRDRLVSAHARGVQQLTHLRLPLYGLPPSWAGSRASGSTTFELGVERRPDGSLDAQEHATVELMHEHDPRYPDGLLVIESSNHFSGISAEPLATALSEFLGRRTRKGRPAPESDELDYSSVTVGLDGREVAFAVAHLDGLSVARWAGYEVTVTLKAADWPLTDGLELRRITDVTPYLDGRRRALEQASGYQLG